MVREADCGKTRFYQQQEWEVRLGVTQIKVYNATGGICWNFV
uniref:Uncharacterized protein n=1 Tax=Candidozyma auris TaxID=498019 RepID=A0A0L0P1V9_CANAR